MKEKKYKRKLGLLICIPCFLLAIAAFFYSISPETSGYSVRISNMVLTFSISFGLMVANRTDWKN